ncbi:hypothetical protein A9Q84_10010 [Halobacteriovorax marinus]|uniref:Lipoprotein n=1 Tax=Halobacteriovorax marinus TaxID=97084 RepID=A0A1Y5F6Z1_9BACT|nr:hypothetical protein A9Q84_10010 [Halobacteriovorax marinus]
MKSQLIKSLASNKESLVIALLLFTLTSINALAAESSLVSITNDENATTFKMVIDIDGNKDIKNFYKDVFNKKMKRIERKKLAIERIYNGINIEKMDKYEVVNLKSDNFSRHNGGNLELDTLYNGAKGKRKSYDLELNRIGDQWEILFKGKKVNVLHLKSNKVFILGVVGIKDIQVKK